MNIAALQATLRQFAADRDWQPFQTPKNLAMAMMVEAAELAEIFQWMTGEQSEQAWRDTAVKQHIGEEIADVLFYLLQIADHTHTDLQRAVDAKLVINARKYPPKQAVGSLPPPPAVVLSAPSPAGRTHVLLDYENVQPDAQALRALVPDIAEVWLFYGPHQKGPGRHLTDLPLTLVPISKTGKNALDFHLTFYVGFISSRHPDDKIVVVANDQGYEPMLMHARTMGFDVRLQTFSAAPRKTLSAAKKLAPQARPAGKAAATDKPTDKSATQQAVKAADPPAIQRAIKPARKSPRSAATAKTTAAKPAAPTQAVAAKSAAAKPAAPRRPAAKKSASTKAAAKTATRPSAKTPAKPNVQAPANPPATAAQPKAAGASAAVLQKLLANLRRTGEQRPATRAPLLRALLSWLGSGHSEDEAVAALQRLAAAGYLDVTPNGGVNYRL